MKKKGFEYVLVIEAIACMAFCLLQMNFSNIFSTITAFPFEQIGWGLRNLSLSGPVGNVLAIMLYVLICLIPSAIWYLLRKQQKAYKVDYVLIGTTLLMLIVIYYMINPGLFQANVLGTSKWMLGCTLYSLVFGYLVLRILQTYTAADAEELQKGLKVLLFFLNVVFVYVICGQSLGTLIGSIQKVQSSNSISGIETEMSGVLSELTLTYLFLVLHYLVNILPYLLDIAVTFLAIRMLDALSEDRYSMASVKAVERLAGFCVKALSLTVVADVVFNILQLVFHSRLYQLDIAIVIPVFSVVFVLAALLFSRYIQEDQKLKQDNDLFI